MFQYIPKKSKEIYNTKIAHRGFHLKYPENTIPSYIEAINKNYAIELDIRKTCDNVIICMHDRYTKRLLGKKGKTSNYSYDEIKKLNVLDSKEKVPKLEEVLSIVNGKTPILIEVKGYFDDEFERCLKFILKDYTGKIYFHAKNILTFIKLKSIFGKKVFWILNPLRKRFNFIKTRNYKQILKSQRI